MQAVNTHCKFCLDFTASASQKEIYVITINTNENHWSANCTHACIRCPIANLWYTHMFAVLALPNTK